MADRVVIYKSKYGSTEKYAKWIAEDTKADIFKCSDVNLEKIKSYETIIFCGGIYASSIAGFDLIKKNLSQLSNKKIIAVAVGASTVTDASLKAVKDASIPAELTDIIEFFMLRGGFDYKHMTFMHRILMAVLVKMLKGKKPEERTDNINVMIDSYGKTVDFTDRTTIEPIVQAAML